MRNTLSWPLLVAAAVLFSGCDAEALLKEAAEAQKQASASRDAAPRPEAPAGRPTDRNPAPNAPIRIGSFNIQVFGTSKMGKPEVMGVLAQVARQFDVLAIQEIRSKDDTIIPRFTDMINAEGACYDYVVGQRLGRTVSKEQYAYVFDTGRVELDRRSVFTMPDPEDLLHREPLVARFRARGPPREKAFSFRLINVHTDPDETDTEIDALADVFRKVQTAADGEDDVILLGDLNVDENDLGRLGRLPGMAWAISGKTTNTRGTRAYDNLLFDRRFTTEFTGYSGVLDLMAQFDLSLDQALAVSDHLPVWAEFSPFEGGRTPEVASRPGERAR